MTADLRRVLVAGLVGVGLALTGCSGGSSSTPDAGASPSATDPSTDPTGPSSTGTSQPTGPTRSTTSPIPRDPITVPGVRLTPQGTSRRLGQRATVAWRPKQGVVGAIVVAVTAIRRVPLSEFHDFLLDARTRRSTPYFVHATVSNVGRRGLGGYAVPLYLLDRTGALIQASSFRTSFAPCPSGPLPVEFPHGTRTPVCLVYFAPRHGSAAGVTFRPSQDFEAITWKPAPKATGRQ